MHIGVDTGGTFTDLLLWDGRRLRAHKVPSTPQDFSEGVLRGIAEILGEPHTGAFDVTHSATVATNALLERKGARTALITTRGFRDVLEIGRQTRPSLYDLLADRAPPLVPRQLRLEVTERIDAGKQVVRPLEVGEVEDVLDRLAEKNVESVAICLLFSFLHPQHERLIARAARRRGLTVSVSSEILAEFREYERTSTTVVNAYVAPIMQGYIRRLDRSLR
ncbi:MAG: hydantoinase/oxoprolinase family protein, partial [Planctomycetota bacterium]|nr:hydantoinase/oxoprolinase family protein [Planctomycetota bacterium]